MHESKDDVDSLSLRELEARMIERRMAHLERIKKTGDKLVAGVESRVTPERLTFMSRQIQRKVRESMRHLQLLKDQERQANAAPEDPAQE